MPKAAAASRAWFVYMLKCRGNCIYTGITPDVRARFLKHRAGEGGAFTRSHPPLRILAAMRCGSRSEALQVEYALKQLPRPHKQRWAREWRWSATPRAARQGCGRTTMRISH